MTVLLVGIGADTTNCSPTPPVFEDGRFEYIPIPERGGTEGTTESRTYGNTRLRHSNGSLASLLDVITPNGSDGPRLKDSDLRDWPLHFDPNLDALTYGETASRAAYIARLRTLEPGDIVAFYTGLQTAPQAPRHRYVIGAFTVDKVIDCQAVRHDGGTNTFRNLPPSEQDALMEAHATNAHAKRYFANGEIVSEDDGLVIVDGTTPGGRLDRAFRISASEQGPHHYFREELERRWNPAPGGNPDRTAYLGGVKPAHLLDIDPAEFWADLEPYW